MKKQSIFYVLFIGASLFLVWWILNHGAVLEVGKYTPQLKPSVESNPIAHNTPGIWQSFGDNLHHPLSILLLQILTIIVTARIFGWLMVKIGQPTVIGEIAAGILLGPSFLGLLFPEFSSFLFPKESLGNLNFLSQIGLVLFMFIIGMELDINALKKTAADAVVISHVSIVFPYLLGVILAFFLYREYAPDSISYMAFALFVGTAMSITAFPVLARIVQERDLAKHPIGAMAIACAAADDVTAWCILALVIAIVKAGSIGSAFMTVGLSLVYVLFMLFPVRYVLERIAYRSFARETVNKAVVAIIFSMLIGSAYLAEIIGIHALFGAFLAGVIIPQNPEFRHVLANKIEDISLVLLLPLFFVLTGLRTQINLLNEPHLWGVCALVIMTAIAGKFVGSAFAARFVGQTWQDSLNIGALMNTRGLMELVVLNIGYDLGILTPSVFAMFVIMALFTTFMTGPAMNLINWVFRESAQQAVLVQQYLTQGLKILISFGQPNAGSRILNLINDLKLTQIPNIEINALHLTPSADISMTEAAFFEKEGFAPILKTAQDVGVVLKTNYKATNNLNNEIIRFANDGGYNLMLVGSSRPMFSNDETGGKVLEFFESVDCSVGVLIDRGVESIKHIVLIINNLADVFLIQYIQEFIKTKNNILTVFDKHAFLKNEKKLSKNNVEIKHNGDANMTEILRGGDLILVSRAYWDEIKFNRPAWVDSNLSILIVNDKNGF